MAIERPWREEAGSGEFTLPPPKPADSFEAARKEPAGAAVPDASQEASKEAFKEAAAEPPGQEEEPQKPPFSEIPSQREPGQAADFTHAAPGEKGAVPPWLQGGRGRPPQGAAHAKTDLERQGWLDRQISQAYAWFLKEGNIWVSIGVLFFLVAFTLLFKFAADKGWMPIELRLAMAAAAGMAMTGFGWRMRENKNRRVYSLMLQGGGIGLLYLVVLASSKMTSLLPPAAAGVLMLFFSIATVILAVRQEFQPLALIALIAGYATPLLLSTGSGKVEILLAIHALLNLEILLISIFRPWKIIQWAGFAFASGTGFLWGLTRWDESKTFLVEPFIILLALNFLAISILPLFDAKIKAKLRLPAGSREKRCDLPLVICAAFVFLVFQAAVLSSHRYLMALSCLGLGLLMLGYGRLAISMKGARELGYNPRLFLVLSILFTNLALPFCLQQVSTSAIWALEGAAFIALSSHLGKGPLGNVFVLLGCAMQAAAPIIYHLGPHIRWRGYSLSLRGENLIGLLNFSHGWSPLLLSGFIMGLAALASCFFLARLSLKGVDINDPPSLPWGLKAPNLTQLAWTMSIYGTIWWIVASRHFNRAAEAGVPGYLVLALPALAGLVLSRPKPRKESPAPQGASSLKGALSRENPHLAFLAPGAAAALPAAIFAFQSIALLLTARTGLRIPDSFLIGTSLPWQAANFLALLALAVLSSERLLRRSHVGFASQAYWAALALACAHFAGHLLQALISRRYSGEPGDAGFLAFFIPFAILMTLLTPRRMNFLAGLGCRAGAAAATWILLGAFVPSFFLLCARQSLPPNHLLTLPALNSVDLWQLLFLASAVLAARLSQWPKLRYHGRITIPPLFLLAWLALVSYRAAWILFGEAVRFSDLSRSPNFNGVLAVSWGLLALGLILIGQRFSRRVHWLMGAWILALVTAKLLIIDLTNTATMVRILAFMLMGGLFLLIGWLAPIPPKRSAEMRAADYGDAQAPNGPGAPAPREDRNS